MKDVLISAFSFLLFCTAACAQTPMAAGNMVDNKTIVMGPNNTLTSQRPTATVATLPSCSASLKGQMWLVTDALLPLLLGIISGGGAVTAGVTCNGTNWVVE